MIDLKTLSNLGWMLLGVAVGSGGVYLYSETSKGASPKKTINKIKKQASKKIENMMGE